ncbi:hypothetical protein E4U21_004229 [Claviceps maximensis]|nr:hypothetical protein E4U21_004229 [Claviceps maximensis]
MAADLIMPTLPADQQQSRHYLPNMYSDENSAVHIYKEFNYRPQTFAQSQMSPVLHISPLDTSCLTQSPPSTTPSSPIGMPFQPGGRPLYMPAVLRRCDEFPPTMVSRCRTAGSTSSSDSNSTLKRANALLMSIPGLSMLGHHFAQRPATESNMTLECDWELDSFPEVSGMPTRKHWKPDSESTICDDPVCRRTFNYFVRRHHCRKCGDIFCDWHSSAVLPLDENAEFNPRADPSRACNYCFNQVKSLHKRNGSHSSGSTIDDIPTPTTPVNAPRTSDVTPPHKPEVPASASRDWNWSTF